MPGSQRRPVPLPAILEPVGHLSHAQTGLLGQQPLLVGRGVTVVFVRVFEVGPGSFFEAVDDLLSVPDGPG